MGHIEFNDLVIAIAFERISGKTDIFRALNDMKGNTIWYKQYIRLVSDKRAVWPLRPFAVANKKQCTGSSNKNGHRHMWETISNTE